MADDRPPSFCSVTCPKTVRDVQIARTHKSFTVNGNSLPESPFPRPTAIIDAPNITIPRQVVNPRYEPRTLGGLRKRQKDAPHRSPNLPLRHSSLISRQKRNSGLGYTQACGHALNILFTEEIKSSVLVSTDELAVFDVSLSTLFNEGAHKAFNTHILLLQNSTSCRRTCKTNSSQR